MADADSSQRLFQLETLYEIARECATLDSEHDVLRVLLWSVMGAFGAVRGVAFVGETTDGRLQAIEARGFGTLTTPERSQDLRQHVQPYLTARTERDARRCGDTWARAAGMEAWTRIDVDPEGSARGMLALGPRLAGSAYSQADCQLLEQIARGACAHLRNLKLRHDLQASATDLERRVRALSVANEIASAIGAHWTVPRVHRFLLERVVDAVGAVESALAIRTDGEWSLAARSPAEAELTVADRPDDSAVLAAVAGDDLPAPGTHEVVVPLALGNQQLAALWLRRDGRDAGFDADDAQLLQVLGNEIAVVLDNGRLFQRSLLHQQEQFRMRAVLEQYVAPAVVDRMLDVNRQASVQGTRLTVTVLKADMRASTELTVGLDPEVTLVLMNEYLALMTDILVLHDATIDRIEGDGIVALFGAPEPRSDDAVRAVRAAQAMHAAFAGLLVAWHQRQTLSKHLGMGVGVATGEVVAANIGSAKRLHYTTTGPAINLAARLADRAPAGTLQLDECTWSLAGPALRLPSRRPRPMRAKGFPSLVPVYRLRC